MNLQIRPFHESDTDQVLSHWQEVFEYPDNVDPHALIQKKLSVQPQLFLACVLDDQIVATVMGIYDGHTALVSSLAVSPDVQR